MISNRAQFSIVNMGAYIKTSEMEEGMKYRAWSSECLSDKEADFQVLDLEIDRGCDPRSRNFLCSGESGQIQLYKYNEVPHFLQGNPYVESGYRSILPFSQCFQSLFVWNNETINVWSHLMGFFLFGALMIFDNTVDIPKIHGSVADHMIITLALACFQFCMMCSAGYHLFQCHSEKASSRWLALDLAGISVGLIGCYLPGVHYAFYCLSVWRDVYLIIIAILFGAVLFFQTTPRYLSNGWFQKRIALYCGLVGYGIIPTIHWVYLNGGTSSELVRLFLPRVSVMYLLGILAFAFYMTKFPERCFPGRFDYIGSSHQWWHFIVVVAFYWWHQAGKEILAYRVATPCIQ